MVHGGRDVGDDERLYGLHRPIEQARQFQCFVAAKVLQHKRGRIHAARWPADIHAQAGELIGAQLPDDGAHAIVAACAAIRSQPERPKGQIEIVKDHVLAAPGKIYVAAPERHLQLENEHVRARAGDPVRAQRPSGTVLFESMARVLGARGLGVLLTGMGDDGAHGLLRLRQCGGHTIAEDESTAVVYGMPAEAVRLGAVAESLPLTAIAPRILQLTGPRREVA